MARIADKHGLTNKYRPIGQGKRVVKRGRPRKYLLESKGRKVSCNHAMTSSESNVLAIILAIVAGIVLCWFAPIFIPIVLGVMLIAFGDVILKKIWKLPSEKGSLPASIGWIIVTSFEMGVAFFMCLLILIDEIPVYVLVIDIIIYALLSTLILIRRNKKIKKLNSDSCYDGTVSLE